MNTNQLFAPQMLKWRFMAVGFLAAACFASDAAAVITIVTGYTGVRTLTMRVGTPTAGAVDTVQFNVDGPTAGNSLPTAASRNGDGVAINASSAGVPINMQMRVPAGNTPQIFSMTVTSPAALNCTSGGCGSTSIPFSSIRWTVSPPASGPNANFDFQSGTFAGGTTQSLNNFAPNAGTTLPFAATVDFSSTLNFNYVNTTAYPAGNYSGTVVYTATLP